MNELRSKEYQPNSNMETFTMKVIINGGLKDYVLEKVPIHKIDEDEILIRVEACDICAGDVKYWDRSVMFWGGEDE